MSDLEPTIKKQRLDPGHHGYDNENKEGEAVQVQAELGNYVSRSHVSLEEELDDKSESQKKLGDECVKLGVGTDQAEITVVNANQGEGNNDDHGDPGSPRSVASSMKEEQSAVENNPHNEIKKCDETLATTSIKKSLSQNESGTGRSPVGDKQSSSLTEEQAGITEYIGQHSGFSAIIKQRYSDFIVNEIDQDGCTVHLTDLSAPVDEINESCKKETKNESEVVNSEILSQLEGMSQGTDKCGKVNIEAPDNKELRTQIHLFVKQKFSQFETKTVDEDGQKFIQVIWKKGKGRADDMQWPASQKNCPFVKFVLYKENKDTADAIGLIARNLRLKENLFQYAGIKDRRGKTSQEVTARKVHPKKLAFLNKTLYNMGLGNFRYVGEPLKLGQLKGNHFTIVLRNVLASNDEVEKSLTSLKTKGFINYFGLQRFGTTSIPTYEVGRALLKSDWQSAVNLILMPRNDHEAKDKFQQVWAQTKDPEATLNVLPKYCGLERTVLEGLKKKMSPLNCLDKIHRNTRLLYVHSYQSRVWNQMASRRLKEFGHRVVAGDLVLKQGTDQSEPLVVTEETLGDFSLHDVVLPLPGFDIIYPQNAVHGWYKKALEADDLDIDNMKRPQKDYSLPGAYRPLSILPSQVSWETCHYDDFTLPLTLSDLDRLKGDAKVDRKKHGKLKAVILDLSLPQSCYATMALREVLRQDTSHAHQTSLNVT